MPHSDRACHLLGGLVVTVMACACTGSEAPSSSTEEGSKLSAPASRESSEQEQAQGGDEIGPQAPSPEFTVVLPQGWNRAPPAAEEAYETPPDLILAGETTDDFSSNVSFFKSDEAGTLPLERYPRLVMLDLAQDPGPDPELVGKPQQLEVAGEDALAFDYELATKQEPYMVRQVLFYRDEDLWFATLAAAPVAFDAELDDLDSMLESWSWQG